MQSLSAQDITSILELTKKGMSVRDIGLHLNLSTSTISKYRQLNGLGGMSKKNGRPNKLSNELKRYAAKHLVMEFPGTAKSVHRYIVDHMNISVGYHTVRNALIESGLHAGKKVKKPKLFPRHIKARKEFAEKYSSWTVEDWKKVIFSDETKINRICSDGIQWCWKSNDPHQLLPHEILESIKHGGGNIKIWGCMTHEGPGFMCRIDGNLDADLYCQILGGELHSTVRYYNMDRTGYIFQHDNDPKHTSKKAKEFLASHHINVLDWPAQSPDLNPIEHLWTCLKRALSSYRLNCTSTQALWERVELEWNQISSELCARLVESMPARIQAVIQAKGRHTKY